jgi:DNA-binding response OmpR family regulator
MPKIMLIEDDPTMRSLLNTILDMEGYPVVIPAMDTLEGIFGSMRNEKPDLVILDVNLRHGTGFDLMQRIKNDGDLNGTRVLMSSGIDYHYECLEAGAQGFLLKPYMSKDLIQLIEKILKTDNGRDAGG